MSILEQWQEQITEAAREGTAIQLQGGGSKAFYGQAVGGTLLDTRAHQGIVDYEPTELVVTARCGTPLAELEATLGEQRQMLAFEPPHFGAATVGGCVAAGLSGPRRLNAGPLRDFVLGAQLLDGRAMLLSFGGQVMKNVAGYDVSRLLAGSLGTLGIITQVSLKVLPMPEQEQTRVFALTQQEALNTMQGWASLPLPISATCWHEGALRVRLSGAESAVAAAALQLGGDACDAASAQQYWQQLKEQQWPFFSTQQQPLWRLALPATTPELTMDGISTRNTVLEWHGMQRWIRTELPAQTVRNWARKAGGHATLFRSEDKSAGVFTALQPGVMTLHKNLKKELDPAAVFNPGRMYPTL